MIGTFRSWYKSELFLASSRNFSASSSLPRYRELHFLMFSSLKPLITISPSILFLTFSVNFLPSLGRDVRMRRHLPMVFSIARSSSLFVPGVYSSYPSSSSSTLCLWSIKIDLTVSMSSFSRSCSSATSSASERFSSTFLNGIEKTKSKGNSERKFLFKYFLWLVLQ